VLVIPALDLREGQVVRLRQGDFDRETRYPVDPLEQARAYAGAGARRLHLVDLDAARGTGDNRELVEQIVAGAGVEVQVAGGVRSAEAAGAWLRAGAAAVVMGTVAVRQPEVLESVAAAHPGRVLAALDARGGQPAVTGWSTLEETTVAGILSLWSEAPLAGVVLTSVDRDGLMQGPDLELLRLALGDSAHPIIYSGGISSLADLESVARTGARGVILGRSLLEGRIAAAEALALSS
jgi:phosphoribosylformimino-5-aminoimidazole carboxamide ribotide isomerase